MDNSLNILKKVCPFLFIILLFGTFLPGPAFGLEKYFRNSLGMKFALIPAGTFIMGSPPGEPHRNKGEVQHQVTISRPFYLQTTEVTLKQWRALMRKKFFGRRKGKGNMPVVRVSWHDCMKFIKKLNNLNEGLYRLPTEAEWEYACRAGTKTAYSWRDSIDCSKAMYNNSTLESGDCLDYVRSKGLAVNRPARVKSYQPNAWGIYDMHGNVWEWCGDWYGDYKESAQTDPFGPDSGTEKVRRGGSWFKHGYSCRSANRAHGHPPTRYKTTGFRVLREAR
ncbi:MAG: formylglycine-generating enzyme family protein [Deltaproteobacteria bacterium]|nr:formylglycine-generating enzyme family protein [Deltaproteobacteria bacterium]MBW2116389.1 formylglycine-generating enzyme family protein [Deltaproteobacteria bacterium]MBW2343087.1 formylglycine-generating enzyme family protein [Deltaproteobacteria bacterium]